jgi:hypothetical protein
VTDRLIVTVERATLQIRLGAVHASHASSHIRGGNDEIDADLLSVSFVPTNYTRTVTAPALNVLDLTAHLAGIDEALADVGGGTHASDHIRGGADEIDGDRIDIDFVPTYYTRDLTATNPGGSVEHLAAHLKGLDTLAGGAGEAADAAQADIDAHIVDASAHTGVLQPLDGDLTAFAALDATAGIIAKTGVNAYTRLPYGTTGNTTVVQTEAGGTVAASILPAATATTKGAVKALKTSAAAPTVNDDTNDGYEVGQFWLETTNKVLYQATDVTAGAAVWQRVTGSDLQVFTSSGTWTKPAGCSRVTVLAIGGGGGGGSGRRGAASSTRCGGGGGAGGGRAHDEIAASLLGATETVTVGAGGAGAAAPTSDTSNGSAGSAGGESSFGTHVRATGGRAGNGGATAASIAGGAGVQGGGSGGNGTNGNGSTGEHGTSGAPGGGGGGGVTSGNNDAGGGNGGQSGWLSGGGAGSAGAAGGGTGTAGTAVTANRPQPGGGGGGGGGNAAGGGGAGGNGALYGAGGGGAGAGTNGATGGNGGNGADGIVVVWSE